jgi:tetratricopeptide (TPR) repeat protein
MQLHDLTSTEKNVLSTSRSEQVQRLCMRAKEQAEAGEFEAARATVGEFWSRIGERPRLEGLDETAQAELLLRAGALTGWIGSARQISGAQEIAKNLITESAAIFERLGLLEHLVEARTDLAICYWREGAVDEARITLDDALIRLGDLESEQRLRAILNKAILEQVSNRPKDALGLLQEASPLFDTSSNHALRGKFHNELATVLKNLGLEERREDYIDRALIEYAAASFHFEEAGHKRFHAAVENNLGFLFVHLRRFDEAQTHVERARSLFSSFKDQGLTAQAEDTRAKVFLGQQRNAEAEAVARKAVQILADGDQESLFAGVLTTHGTALARLGRSKDALSALTRAINVAEHAGDPDSGGIAALTIVEELGAAVPLDHQRTFYQKAESNLARSQYPGIQSRLGECARRILAAGQEESNAALESRPVGSQNGNGSKATQVEAEGFATTNEALACSLEEEVLRYEGGLIKRALEASEGSVTRAARLLGVTHQGLAFILNGRHRNLLSVRTPVKPRRRSIIRYRA